MSKLDELIQELCPDGVEYKKIKEVYKRIKGTPITAAKMKEIADDNGDVKIFAGGKTIVYAFEKDIPNANITRIPAVLVQSRGVIDVVYYDLPFTFKNEMWAYTHENPITLKFLYYVLKNNINKFRDEAAGMGSMPQISLKVTEDFNMPVPPLEVQQEIVRLLDDFTAKTSELQTELNKEYEARKKQYEYLKNKMFSFDKSSAEISKLETYFPDIRNGFVGTATPYFTTEKEGVRYLKGTNIHNGVISDNDYCYITREFHEKHIKSELKNNDILMVQSGHVGECAVVDKQYIGSNCHALIIMSNNGKCSSKYVVHYFHTIKGKRQLSKITTGGTIKHILASDIKKVKIPFPTVEKQKAIVETLDKLEIYYNSIQLCLLDEIKSRQKQYEFYRDKLLTFKELK